MKTLMRSADGERSIWWHWQDLRPGWDDDKETRLRKQQGFCTKGRAWLHIPGNCFHVEWDFGRRKLALTAEFSNRSFSDDAILIHIALPFIINFFFGVERADWVKRLPGIGKGWEDGSREIGFSIHDWIVWIYPWMNSDRRSWSLDVPDFFLGRAKYSEVDIERGITSVLMPEGEYVATYRLCVASWKRPRWPWPHTMLRGEIEVEGGIPVPGKGENSWDMDDDAIYSMTCPASTKEELAAKYADAVLRKRKKYGWQEAQTAS